MVAGDDRVLAEYDAGAAVAALVGHAEVVAAGAGGAADGGGGGVGLGGAVVFARGHFSSSSFRVYALALRVGERMDG